MTPQEERMAKIEGIVEQIDKRIASMEMQFLGRFAILESRFDSEMRWVKGLIIGSWLTLILAIIFK